MAKLGRGFRGSFAVKHNASDRLSIILQSLDFKVHAPSLFQVTMNGPKILTHSNSYHTEKTVLKLKTPAKLMMIWMSHLFLVECLSQISEFTARGNQEQPMKAEPHIPSLPNHTLI